MGAKWRRRTWMLLKRNAGEGNGRVLFASQVRYSINFQWRSYLQLSRPVNIFLRDLDPAFHRPVCYGGLHSLRHCILQQLAVGWWLISISFKIIHCSNWILEFDVICYKCGVHTVDCRCCSLKQYPACLELLKLLFLLYVCTSVSVYQSICLQESKRKVVIS